MWQQHHGYCASRGNFPESHKWGARAQAFGTSAHRDVRACFSLRLDGHDFAAGSVCRALTVPSRVTFPPAALSSRLGTTLALGFIYHGPSGGTGLCVVAIFGLVSTLGFPRVGLYTLKVTSPIPHPLSLAGRGVVALADHFKERMWGQMELLLAPDTQRYVSGSWSSPVVGWVGKQNLRQECLGPSSVLSSR